jgi:hypothetical protein
MIKAIMNVGDIVGVHLILNSKSGFEGEIRFLGVAIGNALNQSINFIYC